MIIQYRPVYDFVLSPRCERDLHSSGMLGSAEGQLPTFRDNISVPSSRVKKSRKIVLGPRDIGNKLPVWAA
jgi:hypothetical protein